MQKLLFVCLTLTLSFGKPGGAVGQSPAPSPALQSSPSRATVSLNPDRTFQTIESIGGNYAQANYTPSATDAVGEFALRRLPQTNARVPIPLKQWESENDNPDPAQPHPTGFKDEGVVNSLFRMMQDLRQNRGITSLTASVWDVPDWMVTNPEAREKRLIPRALYPEVAESMLAFLLRARDTYGVPIDYVSFNEANGGYMVKFTADEMGDFIKLAGPLFAANGLQTKFLTGDTHSTATLVEYARPQLEDPAVRPHLGPVSYHSWWSDNLPDSVFVAIADLAREHNLPVWSTEVGYDAMLYKTPAAHPTWENAWKLAKIQHRVLQHSQATVTHYWTFQNNFPIASKEGEPYPIFFAIKQLSDQLPPGSQVFEATSTDPELWVLAAKGPAGHFMAQVLNTSDHPKTVTFECVPNARIALLQTAEGLNMRQTGIYRPRRRKLTLTLPPQSINTLTTRRAEPVVSTSPAQ